MRKLLTLVVIALSLLVAGLTSGGAASALADDVVVVNGDPGPCCKG